DRADAHCAGIGWRVGRRTAGPVHGTTTVVARHCALTWKQFKIFTLDSRLPTSNNPRMSAKLSIGFLGAGKMATALAKGLVQAKLVKADQIIASEPIDAARSAVAKEAGVKGTASNLEAIQSAQVLVLAVKRDQVDG